MNPHNLIGPFFLKRKKKTKLATVLLSLWSGLTMEVLKLDAILSIHHAMLPDCSMFLIDDTITVTNQRTGSQTTLGSWNACSSSGLERNNVYSSLLQSVLLVAYCRSFLHTSSYFIDMNDSFPDCNVILCNEKRKKSYNSG